MQLLRNMQKKRCWATHTNIYKVNSAKVFNNYKGIFFWMVCEHTENTVLVYTSVYKWRMYELE